MATESDLPLNVMVEIYALEIMLTALMARAFINKTPEQIREFSKAVAESVDEFQFNAGSPEATYKLRELTRGLIDELLSRTFP